MRKRENKNRLTWVNQLCLGYLSLVVFCAIFANWLPLAYEANESNWLQIYQKPFQWQLYQTGQPFHLLGTDDKGRDVGVNLIYGAQTALLISLPTMSLAALTGIFLGLLAGYYGDGGLSVRVSKLLALLLAGFFFFFYILKISLFLAIATTANIALFVVAVVLVSLLFYLVVFTLLNKTRFFRRAVKLPIDITVLKTIELIGAVPRLLLILSLAAFFTEPFWGNLIGLSVLTFWPGIARLTRSEILKIKNLPYIEAAVALGYHPWRVLLRHALPNMLVPLLVAITFGICNLIALEATFAFLKVGTPEDLPSWGRSIHSIQENNEAWWLVLFPGLVMLGTVLSLQNINNLIIKQLQPNASE